MSRRAAPAVLRPATPADCAALSALDVAVWREAYAGLLSASLLAGLDRNPFHDPAFFAAVLAQGDQRTRIVAAEQSGRLVGYCWFGPCRETRAAQRSEIERLYVAADRRNGGLGRRLLDEALSSMRDLGLAPARTTVFAANTHARRFYERSGAREIGRQVAFEDEGRAVEECVYVWDAQ